MNVSPLLPFLLMVFGLFPWALPAAEKAPEDTRLLYVAPRGDDAAPGTREQPLQSVEAAVRRLDASGGTIRLLGGHYRETVAITSGGPASARLLIEAAEGEKVVFEGGADLSGWEPWGDEPGGLFITSTAVAGEVINLWEKDQRFRFLKAMDQAGVAAWPGSFCHLEGGRVLVHTRDGKKPDTLRRNRSTVGIQVTRSQTTLRGIHFHDYLGDKSARAIAIEGAREVEVLACTISNAVRGVSIDRSSREVTVRDCRITDVATGVHFGGIGLEVVDCLITGAMTGNFAIREEADYDQFNGIRFYHPAEQGIIRGCTTAGFWAGLYQKTTPGLDGPKPFVCEGNLFLDRIKLGTASQRQARYHGNAIYGGGAALRQLTELGAEVSENYAFSFRPSEVRSFGDGNRSGPAPFVSLADGNPALPPGVDLPKAVTETLARHAGQEVKWPPEIAARWVAPKEAGPLRLGGEVVCAASERGATITVPLNAAAGGVLHYRETGAASWQTLKGKEGHQIRSEAIAEDEKQEDDDGVEETAASFRLVFSLRGDALQAGKTYEYEVHLNGAKKGEAAAKGDFTTKGGPREIAVTPETPGGLQGALDRALPGDTVRLARGVYTSPALLLHGGTKEAPITVTGAGELETILDGGRQVPVLLEINGAAHVTIEDLQVRLFQRTGIRVERGEGIVVRRCRFLNKEIAHSGYTKGTGLYLKETPGTVVTGCVFTRLLYGAEAIDSPRLTLTRCTAFKNLFAAVALRRSARDSQITYNSFTFTGNLSFSVTEEEGDALASLVCDFNNYATTIRPIGETAARAYAEAGVTPPKEIHNPIQPPARYGKLNGSKRVIDFVPNGDGSRRKRFFQLDAWQKFSGKDAASLFADPQYVDPLRGDFRLLAGSPNILKGGIVGAGEVKP